MTVIALGSPDEVDKGLFRLKGRRHLVPGRKLNFPHGAVVVWFWLTAGCGQSSKSSSRRRTVVSHMAIGRHANSKSFTYRTHIGL